MPEDKTDMKELTHIVNWRRIDPRLTTSGQPTEMQLADIRAMHGTDGALADEAGTVAGLGMKYIHIPVLFDKPTDADFEAFCHAIEATPHIQMHVHCIYNARVSAFFYRYAKSGRGPSEAAAFANMESIWRPGDDWAAFIDVQDAVGQPNRYAGEDY